jgi:hypothetical protein
VGAGVSIYHLLIENAVIREPSACRIGGAGCAVKRINEFGYVTIPTLALTAFALLAVRREDRRRSEAGATDEPDRRADARARNRRGSRFVAKFQLREALLRMPRDDGSTATPSSLARVFTTSI